MDAAEVLKILEPVLPAGWSMTTEGCPDDTLTRIVFKDHTGKPVDVNLSYCDGGPVDDDYSPLEHGSGFYNTHGHEVWTSWEYIGEDAEDVREHLDSQENDQ